MRRSGCGRDDVIRLGMAWHRVLVGVSALLFLAPAVAAGQTPSALKPLMRSFEAYARDLDRLDEVWPSSVRSPIASPLPALPPPAADALPQQPAEVAINQRLRIDLQQAIDLAVQNDPGLQQQIAAVREQQGWLRSVRGRFFPILGLDLAGAYSQEYGNNDVWEGNADVPGYGPDSPFFVPTGGTNRYQTNLGFGFAQFRIDYGNRLRQLQLEVSEAYYRLQLADQLFRIRLVVVDNDQVILDQVKSMKAVGLVPRVDLLRAEARLLQERFRLEQAEALRLSSQRLLSNLVNVPFVVTLEAREAVQLQPPWPLDLEQTIVRGFEDNPQLKALQAARVALQRRADRSAAALLPRIGLFATAGYLAAQSTSPVIELNGCCKGPAFIPGLNSERGDWTAGMLLNWRLFDAGVTAGAVEANRAAAERTLQAEASERNGIRQRLESAFYDHRAALSQIIAANASFQAAKEAYRDSRARYEFGLADYTDLADTIASLTTAMEQRAEAMTLANLSYARLLRELLPVPRQPGQPLQLRITLPSG